MTPPKKVIEIEKFEQVKYDLEELGFAVQTMITDLHEIKGMQQARIAYLYYRKLLWSIQENLDIEKKF